MPRGQRLSRNFGMPLIDVGLAGTSPIAEMPVIAAKLIGGLRSDVVVAHEEFPAAPAAKIFDLPSIFHHGFLRRSRSLLNGGSEVCRPYPVYGQ